ncbi:Protein of unknown function [Pseudoxanthomonas sp. CF385]|uniref:DUF3325 domain-containing protein n=1 Tax=Pseudoxanthomonas sp. CF385 TaxID=1881042 RepID=UPI00089228BF|nr:DUF3325 domain-containing protein [Pseudoxanthomonas sp. CF385]SDQ66329.1 Protein of unknown function [Pseudoxanthomonas sp. CF385]
MPDPASHDSLLSLALIASVAGMGWLALSMQVHAQQAWNRAPSPTALKVLRWMGSAALLAAFVLCLCADHATMAVLVWFMALAGAALTVAFTLSWRPRWLRVLAPWIRV